MTRFNNATFKKYSSNLIFQLKVLFPTVEIADSESLQVGWYHYDMNGKRQKLEKSVSDRHVMTQDHGLVVIGVTEKDAGRYFTAT
jgi:hypothetical protein